VARVILERGRNSAVSYFAFQQEETEKTEKESQLCFLGFLLFEFFKENQTEKLPEFN